jgi:hypothetical protein
MTTRFETAITNPAATTARAWIDSMTAPAQLRSERRLRHARAA